MTQSYPKRPKQKQADEKLVTILELYQLLCNHEDKSNAASPTRLQCERNKLHLFLSLLVGFSVPCILNIFPTAILLQGLLRDP